MLFDMMPCSEEDAEFIEEQADRVFDTIAPPEEDTGEEEFVYKVINEKGSILGGCVLVVDVRKTASIFDLWVEEAYRRKGIASALIREAERKAKDLGCYLVMVGTFDFQAKPFYENFGYTVNDTMTGVPKGHEHYFMTKRPEPLLNTILQTLINMRLSQATKKMRSSSPAGCAGTMKHLRRASTNTFTSGKRSRTRTAGSLPALSAA